MNQPQGTIQITESKIAVKDLCVKVKFSFLYTCECCLSISIPVTSVVFKQISKKNRILRCSGLKCYNGKDTCSCSPRNVLLSFCDLIKARVMILIHPSSLLFHSAMMGAFLNLIP